MGTPVVQASGMSARTKVLMVVSVLVVIAAAVVYFGPRYGIDVGRFFAAEPGALGPPVTNSVKLYPVFDEVASKVRFVLEPGALEITGFQFKAGISGADFDIKGFAGSPVFQQELEAAHIATDGALSYAAGVTAGSPGAISKTVIATINYALLPSFAAAPTCVTVDIRNSIVTARGIDTNVLDMNLIDWKNAACTTAASDAPVISAFTATPAAISSGQSSVLSWVVTDATDISIANSLDKSLITGTGTSATVSPMGTTTYTLTAAGLGGSASAAVTITVAQPAETVPVAIRGDVNIDGKVDISDFNIVVANFGKVPSSAVLGDENKDGVIDIVDFNAVVTFFGTITK